MGRRGAKTTNKTSRLKVFQAQFGFYDSVVAASSQAAALRAWDTHQNLFADGRATLATEAAAVEAALARPETPLRRVLGSGGAFEVEPRGLPTVPDLPKAATKRPRAAVSVSRPKPPPDRSALNAAERAVAELDARRKQEESDLGLRQRDLDAEVVTSRRAYLDSRKAAKAAMAAARAAYRSAGGED